MTERSVEGKKIQSTIQRRLLRLGDGWIGCALAHLRCDKETLMPFIEVKIIKDVLSTEEKSQVIEEITSVFARMKGDEFAAGTWVVINELDDGNWGEGGSVVRAEHVPKSSG